jgi:nucleotide-binding universal stress UspA family protein
MARIVVGVDGSEGSRAAVRFAFEEARLRDATVRLVAAWHIPAAACGLALAPSPVPEIAKDLERLAHMRLRETMPELGDEGGVQVEAVVREGQAADILVEEAADAAMLIVGSRRVAGFRSLFRSVSHQFAHHAKCPVVIVRAPTDLTDQH